MLRPGIKSFRSAVCSVAWVCAVCAAQQPSAQFLLDRAIASQHRSDHALFEYERLERKQLRRAGKVIEDKTFRVAPTGTGTLRLVVEENGSAVAPEFYRKQLRDLEQALVWALNPQESRQKVRVDKFDRRTKERDDLVEAVREGFRATRVGEETRDGRSLVKLQLDPNPAFKPKTRNAEMFAAVRAIVWVEESAGQLVRGEAEVVRDISFGGGLLGKLYKGSRFVIEQKEVAHGIWLPTLYQSDYTGRKFFFSFETHERIEVSKYKRLGPPKEALEVVRRELSSNAAARPPR